MFSDPLSVTYDGSAKSLPRVGASSDRTTYRTADGEFQLSIWSYTISKDGRKAVQCELGRTVPDPTPANVFDDYRFLRNSFLLGYKYDLTRYESDDLPLLRTALLSLVNTAFETRLIAGEK